jgi:hypothetical protein
MATDPDGHTDVQVAALAEELNATLVNVARQHETQVDQWEQRRQAAERARQLKARTQDRTAATLRQLAGQLDGAAGAGGR